mmetsp:Transcript_29311/g.51311  ORF Transcript_29311/g.51311 Transcript_29311/m.51311 type:complete len:115 (+) Transcript_29311:93-437(+)
MQRALRRLEECTADLDGRLGKLSDAARCAEDAIETVREAAAHSPVNGPLRSIAGSIDALTAQLMQDIEDCGQLQAAQIITAFEADEAPAAAALEEQRLLCASRAGGSQHAESNR